jgi:NhaA family Na+:H+ antiporter
MKIKEGLYLTNIQNYLTRFKSINPNEKVPTLTNEQLHILEEVKKDTNEITPPLQRLEHAMHPFVTFLIIPIFALANAGVSLAVDLDQLFSTNVTLGVLFGLTVGKVVGIPRRNEYQKPFWVGFTCRDRFYDVAVCDFLSFY